MMYVIVVLTVWVLFMVKTSLEVFGLRWTNVWIFSVLGDHIGDMMKRVTES